MNPAHQWALDSLARVEELEAEVERLRALVETSHYEGFDSGQKNPRSFAIDHPWYHSASKAALNPTQPFARTAVDCPRATSDMTPCVLRDGTTAQYDDGSCVGCGWQPSPEVKP